MYNVKICGLNVELRVLEGGILRLRLAKDGNFRETLLSRYNILCDPPEMETSFSEDETKAILSFGSFSVEVLKSDKSICISGNGFTKKLSFYSYEKGEVSDNGFHAEISLSDGERLFGLGDESRTSIARRGTTARMDMKNVVSYGPIPYLMSSLGWGLLVNCTYVHTYDLGKSDADKITISAQRGGIDFYVFLPESGTLTDILDLYTNVSGKPLVMPKAFYGYTFVTNEQTNARELLWDCKTFRREDIPCDIVGLEPQWMTKYYDTSVDKKFDEDRFYIPQWLPENESGTWTFFYNLREMGFKLSLWLCNDYDLLYEEERLVGERAGAENKPYSYEGASILDPHFEAPRYQDQLTKKDEAWFKHLEKFVDNGASAFKLDGAFQVNDHPDRLWGGKYFDDEVHNVYPVLYVKQMQEGFTNHTDGRRAIIYTPCMYAGSQKYCASWAGDTGGGYDTVVAMLNYGLSGHTNVTCDMEVTVKEGIHYGFLSPWVQQLGWRNWQQPWFLREELENMIRYYAHLRSSLFPYIYSMAHKAAKTAVPIARALSLMYPDKPEYDYVTNTYLFGDSMLVAVFDMNVTLPEGKWIDFWNGDVYDGNRKVEYKIPEGRGGALFIKAGSIFVTMQSQDYIEKSIPEKYTINVYHGADASFSLIEDDGYTYDYIKGAYAETVLAIENSTDSSFDIIVEKRRGNYPGRDKRPEGIYKESDPVINGIGDITPFDVEIHTAVAKEILLDGESIPFTVKDGKTYFNIPAEIHRNKTLKYSVKY